MTGNSGPNVSGDVGDYISAEYFAAMQALQPSGAPEVVRVFVEGESDIPFWNACLLPWSSASRVFDVCVFRRETVPSNSDATTSEAAASDNSDAAGSEAAAAAGAAEGGCGADSSEAEVRHVTGKQNLLNEFTDDRLGRYLLLAIDADYDWIMEDYQYSPAHPEFTFSERIRSCPYILHTYLYGIENYQCHPAALGCIWPKITGKSMPMKVRRDMERWSEIMSDLFLIHLLSVEQRDFAYPHKKLKGWMHRFPVPFGQPEAQWTKLEKEVREETDTEKHYLEERAEAAEVLRVRLHGLGFEPKNYASLVFGHSLRKCGVLQKLPGFIVNERKERMESLEAEANTAQREQLLNQFEMQTGVNRDNPPGEVSDRLTRLLDDFTDIHLVGEGYKRIQEDLRSIYG